jgi:diadenosine tetraphosphate (Ap4A) HIT family hydrolase
MDSRLRGNDGNYRFNMSCDLCKTSAHKILWQDDFCRVVLLNDADYPAYCRVELLEHIKEMTDLAPENRTRLMKVVFSVETALREVVKPDKINLASLGNKTPHLHWHIIPRFADDKHFPNSHWGEVVRGDVVRHEGMSDALGANNHELSGHAKTMLIDRIKTYIEKL